MKQIIRLTESDLHRLVKEAVAKIMSEGKLDPKWSTKDGEAPNGNFIHDMPRNRRSNTPNSPRLKKNRNIETENTMISEEGGDGANNAAGVYGGAEGQAKNHIVAPAFKTDDDDDFFEDTLNHKNMCGFERV